MQRYLAEKIKEDSARKIVLVSGPRQVGKTTLVRSLPFESIEYLNFDREEDRAVIARKSWVRNVDLVVFDELHKRPQWKQWLKGIYDTEGIQPRLIVTGSARLDVYRKGGDSLAGRYFPFRLHPLSVRELLTIDEPEEAVRKLLLLGGFPEPYLSGSEIEAARWRRTHVDRIIREDLLDLEQVRQVTQIRLLVDLLAERVGATVSFESLARTLEVSPHTVKRWIGILEALFVIFTVSPFTKRIERPILKQPKIFFYDIGSIKNPAARLENLVALHLLKRNHFLEDTRGEVRSLHYIRDREKREVDFVTVLDKSPEYLVEVKSGAPELRHLNYFAERLGSGIEKPPESILLSPVVERDEDRGSCKIRRLSTWLAGLES